MKEAGLRAGCMTSARDHFYSDLHSGCNFACQSCCNEVSHVVMSSERFSAGNPQGCSLSLSCNMVSRDDSAMKHTSR